MSPLRAILRNSILLLAVALSGCDTERHRLMTDHYPSYPEGMRWAIDRGKILRGMNQDQVYLALAAFQTSLISLNSRYDRYAHGYHAALSEQEVEGLNIFRSFVARCAECHTPPLFTNQQIAVIGAPEPDGLPLDVGAQITYGAPGVL